MASILQFVRAEESKPRRKRGELGEVVIFPGVRIERHEEPAEMTAEEPRKRAQEN